MRDAASLITGDTRDRLLAAAVRRRDKDGPTGALVTALVGRRILRNGRTRRQRSVRGRQDAEHLLREWTAAGGTQIFYPLLRERDAA